MKRFFVAMNVAVIEIAPLVQVHGNSNAFQQRDLSRMICPDSNSGSSR
jgi:hypothetical protein